MYLIYLLTNGEILRSVSGPYEYLVEHLAPGEGIVEGPGSWITHRVRNGVIEKLDTPRVPPHSAAHWSSERAEWWDPRTREQVAVQELEAARERTLTQIAQAEAEQARPVREITHALMNGKLPPPAATSKLKDIEERIRLLRVKLAALY